MITHNRNRYTILTIAILLAVTVFFRLYRIADIPLGVNNDAIWESSSARAILMGHWQDYIPFAAGWHGEPIVRLMIVALTPFIGNTTTTVKVASALLGIALLPMVYLFLKKLFDEKISFITTWLVATSGWHIILSRSGWRAIAVPTATVLVLHSLYTALETKRKIWSVIAGVALAITLYTYDAARIVPVVCFLSLYGMVLFNKQFRKQHLRMIIRITIWFFLASLPMIYYAFNNWDIFVGRTTYLLITKEITKYHSLKPLIDNGIKTMGMFVYRGNGNDFFINEPLLDAPSIWVFPIGLIFCIWEGFIKKNTKMLFMLGWFICGILPAFLSEPNGNRAIGAIPPTYFFIAYAYIVIANWIFRRTPQYKTILERLFILYFIGITTMATYIIYIGPYRRIPIGFHPETYVVSSYLKTKQNEFDIYITDNFPRDILTFMLYKSGDPFTRNYTWFTKKESFLTVVPGKKPMIFVMFPTDENQTWSHLLLKKYPTAHRYILPMSLDNWKDDAALIIEVPLQPGR